MTTQNKAVFQSLIGFKINWNHSIFLTTSEIAKFQSLIGFKINWNEMRSNAYEKR